MLKKIFKIVFISLLFISFIQSLNATTLKTYYQDGFPKYYIDENKNITGLCVEIIELIKKKDPTIKIEAPKRLVKFKRIKNDLLKGDIDLFFGMTRTKQREKQFTYIEPPLYKINHVIAVRKDDNVKINGFEDIKKLTSDNIILTNQGTSTAKFLRKQGDLNLDSGAPNISVNFQKLLKKRGRFVYFHNLGMVSTVKKENLQDKIKVLPTSFKTYFHYLAFSKNVSKDVIKKVEKVMLGISQSGELEKIINKYFNIN